MGITDRLKRTLNGQDEEEDEGILTSVSNATTLSWSTRIKGFLICFVLGIVLSIIGSVLVFVQQYVAFAVLYSTGTLTSLASTMFLMGPIKQLKKMFDPTRLIATIILLICIVLTIVSAVVWKLGGLCILFCVLQFLALAWYSISFIPFAREEGVFTMLYDIYNNHSFPAFIACIAGFLYACNSVFVHYAPLLSGIIELIDTQMQGEFRDSSIM